MRSTVFVIPFAICAGAFAQPADPGATLDRQIAQRRQELNLIDPVPEVGNIETLREKLKAFGQRASKIHTDKKTLAQRLQQIDGKLKSSERLMPNPYAKREWINKAKSVANRFCCFVQNNPSVAETIAENVKSGRPPTDGLKKK